MTPRRAFGKATTSGRSTDRRSTTRTEAQRVAAEESVAKYQRALTAAGLGTITTEVSPAPTFYYAEDYHQQYLAKIPARLRLPRQYRREVPRIIVSISPLAVRRGGGGGHRLRHGRRSIHDRVPHLLQPAVGRRPHRGVVPRARAARHGGRGRDEGCWRLVFAGGLEEEADVFSADATSGR